MQAMLLAILSIILLLQQATTVTVTIQVRHADSSPFAAEVNIRNDEREVIASCELDDGGRCEVQLGRGLYLIEPVGTKLDPVSASAAVEIGGRWLGITVGDEAIRYGFVIEDGAVFFDDTPDDAIARPIKPTQADIEAHFAAEDVTAAESADVLLSQQPTIEATPMAPSENQSDSDVAAENEVTVEDDTSTRRRGWWLWIVLPVLLIIGFIILELTWRRSR